VTYIIMFAAAPEVDASHVTATTMTTTSIIPADTQQLHSNNNTNTQQCSCHRQCCQAGILTWIIT